MESIVIYKEKNELSEIDFFRDTLNQVSIRNSERNELFTEMFSFVFAEASNLAGLKEPISEINKTDISEMILKHYSGLSLFEISYAFKLERYGKYESKTELYQMFNAEYVSSIIKKYIQYKKNIKIAHSIEKKSEAIICSSEDKRLILSAGIINCFEEWLINGNIEDFKFYIFDTLYEIDILPKYDSSDLILNAYLEKKSKAIEQLSFEIGIKKAQAIDRGERTSMLTEYEQIKSGTHKSVENRTKALVLKGFFEKIKDRDYLEKLVSKHIHKIK